MTRFTRSISTTWARHLCLALVGIFVLSSVLAIAHRPQAARASSVVSTDWMAQAGFGVALHWTSQSIPSTGGSPAAYCTAVDNFNVNTLAQQLSDAGAGYLLFTISHAQQFFAFPSAKLDSVISGRTCTRDLYSDIYDAIHPLGIKLMFYYPSIATDYDPNWQAASQWNSNPAAFAQLQYDLVTEIGNRYGTKLDGWWVDNCYDGGYGTKYNFSTYANALRSGNANRLVTFNLKGQSTWDSTTAQGIADYQAGESIDLNRLPSSRYSGEGGTQWQTLVAMDNNNWVLDSGFPSPSFSDQSVINYAANVAAQQGAFTYNASPYQDTLIGTATMNQLRALKAARQSTRVEDGGASYAGSWSISNNTAYSGGSAHFSTSASSYAQYSFSGTGVTWYGVAGPDHGKADVYLDGSGTADATVDCYAASWAPQAVYTKTGLSSGSHTLKIVVRSDRNEASSNNYVEVDAFDNGGGGSGSSSGGGNLAIGATVTASSDVGNSDWARAKINDGQRHSVGGFMGWSSSNSTSANHTEWVTLNFGSARTFNRVDLYPRDDSPNAGQNFPIDFTISVSNDGTNWTTVVTQTGYALPSGVQSFTFASQTAQYIGVSSTNLRPNPYDNNFYRLAFAEIEAY